MAKLLFAAARSLVVMDTSPSASDLTWFASVWSSVAVLGDHLLLFQNGALPHELVEELLHHGNDLAVLRFVCVGLWDGARTSSPLKLIVGLLEENVGRLLGIGGDELQVCQRSNLDELVLSTRRQCLKFAHGNAGKKRDRRWRQRPRDMSRR